MTQAEKSLQPKGPWVLLVEDEAELLELLSEKLKAEGYRVLTCSKAQEAIRLMKNQAFGCVVLDLHLETGTGDQVVQHARRAPTSMNFATPILLISGSLDFGVLEKIKRSISGALVKPFGLNEFAEKIRSLCPVILEGETKKAA